MYSFQPEWATLLTLLKSTLHYRVKLEYHGVLLFFLMTLERFIWELPIFIIHIKLACFQIGWTTVSVISMTSRDNNVMDDSLLFWRRIFSSIYLFPSIYFRNLESHPTLQQLWAAYSKSNHKIQGKWQMPEEKQSLKNNPTHRTCHPP